MRCAGLRQATLAQVVRDILLMCLHGSASTACDQRSIPTAARAVRVVVRVVVRVARALRVAEGYLKMKVFIIVCQRAALTEAKLGSVGWAEVGQPLVWRGLRATEVELLDRRQELCRSLVGEV